MHPSHTPTPWKYQCEIELSGTVQIRQYPIYTEAGKFGHPAMCRNEADAAHIVRCVNERDGLIEALERAIGTIQIWHSMHMGGVPSQQEYLWKVYQTSPEMKSLNAVLNAAKREGA